MLTPFLTLLPLFALIFAGWAARRTQVLGPHATRELNRFVVWLALPALLFGIVAHAKWQTLWQPAFIVAFSAGCFAVFAATLALRWRGSRHLADAAIDALNAAYGNTGFIGLPLAAAALGAAALTPALIATILTVCVLFAVAIVFIEAGLQTEAHPLHIARKVGLSLIKNPLVAAPMAALIVPLSGASVPAPVDSFIKLLGGAASPCALIALGLFLAEPRENAAPVKTADTALLTGLKLIVQPLLTWLAAILLHMPPPLTRMCVVLAALPTGTGPFMLAEFYRREAGVTARAILISTLVSLLSVSALLSVAF